MEHGPHRPQYTIVHRPLAELEEPPSADPDRLYEPTMIADAFRAKRAIWPRAVILRRDHPEDPWVERLPYWLIADLDK